ncbi:MAG: universal stress protein [Planctomycetes bacterium]|nr:universal stress protein [Planctomycetota bacterium]
MNPLRLITVGTDFSPPAATALGWAAELARAHKASLLLVHAYAKDDHGLSEDEVRICLAGLAACETERGIPTQVELLKGTPAEVVAKAARDSGSDLLVIGSKGRNMLSRIFMGSVADSTLKLATTPTLVVHPADAARPASYKSLLVATDFSPEADRAAEFAVRVSTAFEGAEVSLMHATQVPGPFVGVEVPAVPIVEVGEGDAVARAGLSERTRKFSTAGVRVQGLTCPGSAVEVLLDVAEDRNSDVIVVGTTSSGGVSKLLLGSIAIDLVHRSTRPVLVVR